LADIGKASGESIHGDRGISQECPGLQKILIFPINNAFAIFWLVSQCSSSFPGLPADGFSGLCKTSQLPFLPGSAGITLCSLFTITREIVVAWPISRFSDGLDSCDDNGFAGGGFVWA
jgi:hypothetical protein